jgi:glycogen operon protein
MWLNGDWLPESDDRGRQLQDASYLVLFNAHHDRIDFKLPAGVGWRTEVDTAFDTGDPPQELGSPQETYPLEGRSLVVLRQLDARNA